METQQLRLGQMKGRMVPNQMDEMRTVTLDADDLVGFILKNSFEATEQILNKKGKPLN